MRHEIQNSTSRAVAKRICFGFFLFFIFAVIPYFCQPFAVFLHIKFWGKIYMCACAYVIARLVLPHKTQQLKQRLGDLIWLKKWRNGLFIFGVSLVLVLLTESAFAVLCFGSLTAFGLKVAALFWSAAILASLIGLLTAATGRRASSILFIAFLYVSFTAINIVKIRYMHSMIEPLDFLYVNEFLPFAPQFLGFYRILAIVVVIAAVLMGIAYLWRKNGSRIQTTSRIVIGAFSLLVLVISVGAAYSRSAWSLSRYANLHVITWDSVLACQEHGFLPEFISEMSLSRVAAPAAYSPDSVGLSVKELLSRSKQYSQTGPQDPENVNLIVYLVESLMDPADFGVKFTSEPIPNLRKAMQNHTSGYAIVPEAFGGSANTEFELFTGMSMNFLPKRSVPYKEWIKQDLPSLPFFLRSRGYRTVAIQADPSSFYNRVQVYPHLGIEKTVWLSDDPNVPRAVASERPADEAIVDSVIEESRKGTGRRFIFAFPSSTHFPYNYDAYLGSKLDIAGRMEPAARRELKTYINALHTADKAIGRMFDHFSKVPEKTMIVVLGDHIPPVQEQNGVYSTAGREETQDFESILKRHRVPLVIWSNYLPKRPDIICSVNFLESQILRMMGEKPEGFLALNDAVYSQFPVLSAFIQTADGHHFQKDDLPRFFSREENDYELIQWDLLMGKQYASRYFERNGGMPQLSSVPYEQKIR